MSFENIGSVITDIQAIPMKTNIMVRLSIIIIPVYFQNYHCLERRLEIHDMFH